MMLQFIGRSKIYIYLALLFILLSIHNLNSIIFINNFFKIKKIKISQETINLLVERSLGERKNLLIELNKIENFSKDKTSISYEEIFKLTKEKGVHFVESENVKFEDLVLNKIPSEWENFDAIIGEHIFMNNLKMSKLIKHGLLSLIRNPQALIKSKRNLRFHFDMMHGKGNLSKAIMLLDDSEKKDFELFLDNSVSFNPHNMFICKSKKILKNYYDSLFPWLERCEKEFGFELTGYGLKRIYGFLAERYLSYWFQKYTNFKLMPILFKDLSDFRDK